MKNLKKEQGITLIALIITIIVMIILVAVSVSVALQGGIFDKATKAKDQTKEAVIREQLQDIVLGKLDVNNNTIPEELGSVTLDGVTYAITATEGTADEETGEKPITISVSATGKDTITYDLKEDLKISGVESVIKENKGGYKTYKLNALPVDIADWCETLGRKQVLYNV